MWKQSVGNRCRRDSATILENQVATLKNYTDRGFTLQEQLDNLSLVDMNGRVYDPTVGRFISADPAMQFPYFSQTFDRYSYVFNEPLSLVDPSGYDACMHNPNLPPDSGEVAYHLGGLAIGGALGGLIGGGVAGYFTGGLGTAEGVLYGRVAGAAAGGFLAGYLYDTFCSTPKIPPKILPTPKPQPQAQKPKAPPPENPSPKSGPGGVGGGGENGPNKNPQFENLGPTTCRYTWYDAYSDGRYLGSELVSVQCF